LTLKNKKKDNVFFLKYFIIFFFRSRSKVEGNFEPPNCRRPYLHGKENPDR
jgi:hypothetical protein